MSTASSSMADLPPSANLTELSNRQPGLRKLGQGIRSWIRVDTSGNSEIIEVDKFTLMRRCDLPTRDLRMLDPLVVHPSTILGREKAIVVNLERIRCIITAEEVLIFNSADSYVLKCVIELQRRLPPTGRESDFGGSSPDYLPFEFRALEVALETACTFLDSEAAELEIETYPLLDGLTSKISVLNLERVRRLKSRLLALTRRVQKVRNEIEQLRDDDDDMAEMYLTKKKIRMESSFYGHQSIDGASISAPVPPVSSPPDSRRLEKSLSIARSSESDTKSVVELEMLLGENFDAIDSCLNKLISLKEYIDDTEAFINLQLDNVRNRLIQFDLLVTAATFAVAIFGLVAGIFGMNFEIPMFKDPDAFKWVLLITGATGIIIFCSFLWFFKHKRLMLVPL